MGRASNKSAAIRGVLADVGKPLMMEELQPRVEKRLQQVFGRQKLYTLLSVMQVNREVKSAGRADARAYGLTAKGRKIHARQC